MTRTLADYRPQHDEDCAYWKCGTCGLNSTDCYYQQEHPRREADRRVQHPHLSQTCTCGLDALLATVKDHDHNAALLPADPSAAVTTETLPDTERALVNAVVMAWHALRVEEVRVWGPVKIDHAGRCGAQTNALMDAIERLATSGRSFSEAPPGFTCSIDENSAVVGYHGTQPVSEASGSAQSEAQKSK